MIGTNRRAKAARRRTRRLARATHDLADGEWAAITSAWGGCAYCGRADGALQRDCVLPISRGGRYTLDNVVPACRSCNASKCNAEVTVWMRRRRFDERTFLDRWRTISKELGSRFAGSLTSRPGSSAPDFPSASCDEPNL